MLSKQSQGKLFISCNVKDNCSKDNVVVFHYSLTNLLVFHVHSGLLRLCNVHTHKHWLYAQSHITHRTTEEQNCGQGYKLWNVNAPLLICASCLPRVRENTGSAELRISSETQLAIIWKKLEVTIFSENNSFWMKYVSLLTTGYLCEVGVLCTRQEASEERGTIEAHHWGHHQITENNFKDNSGRQSGKEHPRSRLQKKIKGASNVWMWQHEWTSPTPWWNIKGILVSGCAKCRQLINSMCTQL